MSGHPMPEKLREWEEHRALAGCETETGLRILVAKADAAIAELRSDARDGADYTHQIEMQYEEEKERAEKAEAKVAELNRVLATGREEYELVVAEMDRRGEEVARLKQFPDEVVKALENARIAPPTLSGSEEYNEGVARCVEIAAALAARKERRQP